MHESRTLEDCWRLLDESPASLLILELTKANAGALLERLVDLTDHRPSARAVICGERHLRQYEWIFREAGAVEALFSPRRIDRAASLVERHLSLAPQEELTFRESVWRRLPWGS